MTEQVFALLIYFFFKGYGGNFFSLPGHSEKTPRLFFFWKESSTCRYCAPSSSYHAHLSPQSMTGRAAAFWDHVNHPSSPRPHHSLQIMWVAFYILIARSQLLKWFLSLGTKSIITTRKWIFWLNIENKFLSLDAWGKNSWRIQEPPLF